jgi:hypothetical protein
VRAVVNCRVCEPAVTLLLLAVTICKCSINPITNRTKGSRDSSVGIATGYGLDDQGGGSSSPGREKISLLHIVQTGSGVHLTFYKMGTGGKAAGA